MSLLKYTFDHCLLFFILFNLALQLIIEQIPLQIEFP